MRGKRARQIRKMIGYKGAETRYIYRGGQRVLDNCSRKFYLTVKKMWKTYLRGGQKHGLEGGF